MYLYVSAFVRPFQVNLYSGESPVKTDSIKSIIKKYKKVNII